MKFTLQEFTIPKERRAGAAFLVASVLLALIAQLVLYLSTGNSLEYWKISSWLPSLGNNTSPLPGLLGYVLAAILFAQGLGRLNLPKPAGWEASRSPPVKSIRRCGRSAL
jgi:hypothetical protein